MSLLPLHVSPQDELIQKIADAIVDVSVADVDTEDDRWVEGYANEFALAAYEVVKGVDEVSSSLPAHVSHSQYGSWLRCQKAFQLERIQRAPKTPAWWLVGGSAVHEVTEHLDREAFEVGLEPHNLDVTIEIERLSREKLTELVAAEEEKSGVPSEQWFAAGRGTGQGKQYWWENAPKMVSNWLQWRTEKGWEIATIPGNWDDNEAVWGQTPLIEYEFEIQIGPVSVKGAPDRVMVLPNGDWVVVDLKSGSSTPKEPLQLGLYATVLELLGFTRPKYGTFVKVKDGESTPLVPLEKYSERYFLDLFTGLRGQLDLAVETGSFLPNVGDSCRTCSVQSSCYAIGGSESAIYDPLDPNYQTEGQQAA